MTEAALTTYVFELTIKISQAENADMSRPTWIFPTVHDNLIFSESIDNCEIELSHQSESEFIYKVGFHITSNEYPKGIKESITEFLSFNEELTSFEMVFEFPAE